MNNNEQTGFNQPFIEVGDNLRKNKICRDLRRAIKVVNAEYQQIDCEDSMFLTDVLHAVIEFLEVPEANLYGTN